MGDIAEGTTWRPDPSDPHRERVWLGDSWGSTTRLVPSDDARISAGAAGNPNRSSLRIVAGILGAFAFAVGLGGVIAGIVVMSSADVGVGLAVLFSGLVQAAVLGGLSFVCTVLEDLRATSKRAAIDN